jgi:hypothetical protein
MSFSRLVLLVSGRETWVTTFSFGIGVLRVFLTVSSFYLEMGNVGDGGQGWPDISDQLCHQSRDQKINSFALNSGGHGFKLWTRD